MACEGRKGDIDALAKSDVFEYYAFIDNYIQKVEAQEKELNKMKNK